MNKKLENGEVEHLVGAETSAELVQETGSVAATRKRGAGKEVERILLEKNKPLHLKLIMVELAAAGFTNTYQTMSGVLQILCKKKKVFKKVGPATYALIGYKKPVKARISNTAKSADPFSEKAELAKAATEALSEGL